MHRIEFRGGPRAGEVAHVAELAGLLPVAGGRYRLDGATYGFEVGFDEPEPGDPDGDVEHVRPAAEAPAQTRPVRRRTTRR